MQDDDKFEDEIPYASPESIDFSIIASSFQRLPFFSDDLYLGMQAINVGLVDPLITESEYSLLFEYIEIEKTPVISALTVSALSQMWIFGLYEVLRMWRDRKYQFDKLFSNGGIECKLASLDDDDPLNMTMETRKRQLERYNSDTSYREEVQNTWAEIEPVYRMVELFRINLAKHCAPGKDGMLPRAPGYGRINMLCGALDYELLMKDGYYTRMNRRDIADALRNCIQKAQKRGEN